MNITKTTETTTVLTLTLTEQEREDLQFIVGFDLTIPEAVSSNPADPRRVRVEKILQDLQEVLRSKKA